MTTCYLCNQPIQEGDPASYSGGEVMHDLCFARSERNNVLELLAWYTVRCMRNDAVLDKARSAVNLNVAGETLESFRARMQVALTEPTIPEPPIDADDTRPHQL